jgi:hypothetical protein
MLRLTYLSAATGQCTVELVGDVIRFGTDATCEVHLNGAEHGVLPQHGELVRLGSTYCLKALHPTWVNGQASDRAALNKGDRIRVGSLSGPEIELLEAPSASANAQDDDVDDEPTAQVRPEMLVALMEADQPSAPATAAPASADPWEHARASAPAEVTESAGAAIPLPDPNSHPEDATEIATAYQPPTGASGRGTNSLAQALKVLDNPPEEVARFLTQAKEEIDQARSDAPGARSGRTLLIVAKALAGVNETGEVKTRRWRRSLTASALVSVAVVGALSAVIWAQNRRINTLVSEKAVIDAQIQAVLVAMDSENDGQRLEELEGRWERLVGSASEKLSEVKRASASRAEELSRPSDPLEQEIRKILHSFHADTYAIPPVFRRALLEQVEELRKSPNLPAVNARRRQMWPNIQSALSRKQLPSELGYIAFTESSFDPNALNPKTGAAGMWQLMDTVARSCGITVGPAVDDRFDPRKSSDAAACYLSNLLIEFGEESFMLALASYNRGENGGRRARHRLAEEPGGFRKRDFWHLYRLKYLPDETREYVPKVLAAAIVLDAADAAP